MSTRELLDLDLDLARRHLRIDGLGRAANDLPRSPAARTRSGRRARPAAASGACSGLTTSCVTPVSSRRSMKTRPPWSRRRAAQPASVTVRPSCSGRGSPQRRSRQLMRASVATSSSSARRFVAARPDDARALGVDDHGRPRAEPAGLRELALLRSACVVGVARDAARREAARSSRARARGRRPRRRRRSTSICIRAAARGRRSRGAGARSRRRSRCRASAGPPIASIRPS